MLIDREYNKKQIGTFKKRAFSLWRSELGGRSLFDFITWKSTSSIIPLFRVSSLLIILIFQSVRLDAVISGVTFRFSENRSGQDFRLQYSVHVLSLIYLSAISTHGLSRLSIAAKVASSAWLPSVATTISTCFLKFSLKLFLIIWLYIPLLSTSVTSLSCRQNYRFKTNRPAINYTVWVLPSTMKSLKDSFNCLRSSSCSDARFRDWLLKQNGQQKEVFEYFFSWNHCLLTWLKVIVFCLG